MDNTSRRNENVKRCCICGNDVPASRPRNTMNPVCSDECYDEYRFKKKRDAIKTRNELHNGIRQRDYDPAAESYHEPKPLAKRRERLHYKNGGAPMKSYYVETECLGLACLYSDGDRKFYSVRMWHPGTNRYIGKTRICSKCQRINETGVHDIAYYDELRKKGLMTLSDAARGGNKEVDNGASGCAGQTG